MGSTCTNRSRVPDTPAPAAATAAVATASKNRTAATTAAYSPAAAAAFMTATMRSMPPALNRHSKSVCWEGGHVQPTRPRHYLHILSSASADELASLINETMLDVAAIAAALPAIAATELPLP